MNKYIVKYMVQFGGLVALFGRLGALPWGPLGRSRAIPGRFGAIFGIPRRDTGLGALADIYAP